MKTMGQQNNEKEDKLLTTNFEVKVEKRKVEGLITFSIDQQILKFKVDSGTDQEVWGVYFYFQSIHSNKQLMAFYSIWFSVTTENPNVMMREHHNTRSCKYIIICQDC